MPISQDRRKIFIHIPKCAGHSIEKAIGIHHTNYSLNDFSIISAFGKELQHMTLREIEKTCASFNISNSKIFTIMRNPADRIKSEYYWSGPWKDIKEFEREYIVPGLKLYKTHLGYRHLAPQYFFILSGKDIKITNLYLLSEMNKIQRDMGISKIPHANSSENNIKRNTEFVKIAKKYYSLDCELYERFETATNSERCEIINQMSENFEILDRPNMYQDLCEMKGHIFNNLNFITEGLWQDNFKFYIDFLINLESHKSNPVPKSCKNEQFILNIPNDCRRNKIASYAIKNNFSEWLQVCRIIARNPNLSSSKLTKVETILTNNMARIIRLFNKA